MKDVLQESTDLVPLSAINLPALFQGDGLDDLIEKIEKEVRGYVPDLSTDKGRKDVASLAYKVARSKTALDDAGKDLVSDIKQRAQAIDKHRKLIRDRLDALKDEVRRPLTEWEDAEKSRVQAHRDRIAEMNEAAARTHDASGVALTASDYREVISRLEAVAMGEQWEEFAAEAARVRDGAIAVARRRLNEREQHEAEQAELARLRREQEDRAKREREEAIARDAADRALATEREAVRKRETEAETARDAERQAAKQRETELQLAAERAERARLQAIEDARATTERKEREAEDARRRDAEDQARRDADVEHRRRFNGEALAAMTAGGIDEHAAKLCVKLIAAGKVPNIFIRY